jgi:pimeloyl-ACP methyl ester carboxylesterase
MRVAHDHTVKLPHGRVLRVRSWPGEGRPLVLLHGLLDSCAGWDWLARSTRRPCVAIDLPGFGHSDPPTRPLLSAYAEDVTAVLLRLGVGSCTLVGHSLGGGVATAAAELAPERIAGLVLLAPVGFGTLRLAEFATLPIVRRLAGAALPFVVTTPGLLDAIYRLFVTTPTGPGPTDDLRMRLAADRARGGLGFDVALRALGAASRSPAAFHRRCVKYGGAVSVLWGARDALVPLAHARGVLDAFPQAELHVWPDVGHHPQRECPGELAERVELAAAASAAPTAANAA